MPHTVPSTGTSSGVTTAESADGRSRFIGIGIGSYGHDGPGRQFDALPSVVDDVANVQGLLESLHFRTDVHPDLTQSNHSKILTEAFRAPADGPLDSLVVLWSGHGEIPEEGTLRLVLADSEPDIAFGMTATALAGLALRSRARQILLLIDTCFSGNTVGAMTAVARLQDAFGETDSWVGVLSSARSWETASGAGSLVPTLVQVLTHGPTDPHLKARFHSHNQGVRGDDLIEAVKREWPANLDHQPSSWETGLQDMMFPNPLFVPPAADALDAQLLLLAQGRTADEQGNFFSGRVTPLTRIVTWLHTNAAGIGIVTGLAGTGKSAVAGRITSLSNPEERAAIDAADIPDGTDPGVGTIHAHVHAAGTSAEQLVATIDQQLVATGVIPAAPVARNRFELMGALHRLAPEVVPRIVLDGLDEVGEAVFGVLTNVLQPLARRAQILVTTRNVDGPEGDLISAAQPTLLVDLSTPEAEEETRRDVRDFVARRLADSPVSPADIDLICDRIFGKLRPGEGPFLVARLVTTQLRSTPEAFSDPNWSTNLALSVEEVVVKQLAALTGTAPNGLPAPVAARDLLTALAFARGAGVPDAEWAVMASAVAAETYTLDDVSWAIDQLAEFIVPSAAWGRAVYRLPYERLTTHFLQELAGREGAASNPDPPDRIAQVLGERFEAALATGIKSAPYLGNHYWEHAVDAGVPGMQRLAGIATRRGTTPDDLRPQTAKGWSALSIRQGEAGLAAAAVVSSKAATDLLLEVGEEDPSIAPDLAISLDVHAQNLLAAGELEAADLPARTSEVILRQLAANDEAFEPQLAQALRHRAIILTDAGHPRDAFAIAAESLDIFQALESSADSFATDVAQGLQQMGVLHAALGDDTTALDLTRESLAKWVTITERDPSQLRFLGRVYDALGTRLSAVNQLAGALDATSESVRISRACLSFSAIDQSDLAKSLTNLAVRFAELGRLEEAFDPAAEAVTILTELAETNTYYQSHLAHALINLGNRHMANRSEAEAVALHEAAVAILEDPERTRANRETLAIATNNLAITYLKLSRFWDAVPTAEQAVFQARELVASSQRYEGDLARALSNQSNCFESIGNHEAARRSAEEAVAIRRRQAATDERVHDALGDALNNLSLRLGATDEPQRALAVARESLEAFTTAELPPLRRIEKLAMAHRNLTRRMMQLERPGDAREHMEQAAELYDRLADASPTFAVRAGESWNMLAELHRDAKQSEQASKAWMKSTAWFRSALSTDPDAIGKLALALQALALHYRATSDFEHATLIARSAVKAWRVVASNNPAATGQLVTAVHELQEHDPHLSPAEKDAAWSAALAGLPPACTGPFWAARAPLAADGEQAVRFLTLALDGREPRARRGVQQKAREARRSLGSAFDAAWVAAFGPIPSWLDISAPHVDLVQAWFQTRSIQAESRFAEENSDALLEPETVAAMDEIAATHPDVADEMAVRRELITVARAHGPGGFTLAYAPRRSIDVVRQFLITPRRQKSAVLDRHRDTLISPLGFEQLVTVRHQIGDVRDYSYGVALLNLGAVNLDDRALSALDDLDTRRSFIEWLLGHAPPHLESFADLQGTQHPDPAMKATAFATAAFATALDGDAAGAVAAALRTRSIHQPTAMWAITAIGAHADRHGRNLLPLLAPLATGTAPDTAPADKEPDEPAVSAVSAVSLDLDADATTHSPATHSPPVGSQR